MILQFIKVKGLALQIYLEPAKKRKNLKVFTNSFAERIIFEGKKAVGMINIKNKVTNLC